MAQIQIRVRANGEAEILIYGPIGDDAFGDGKTAAGFERELDALGTVTDIRLRVNSPGGSFFDSVAIFNLLREHPAEVHASVDGIAASAASVIVMAGDLITMQPGAMIMIHNPWSLAIGDSDDMRKAAAVLDKATDTAVEVYAARSGVPTEQVRQMMDDETWFTAEEAVEAGFADTVAGQEDSGFELAAQFDLSRFKNLPQQVIAMTTPQTTSADAVLARETERRAAIRVSFSPFAHQYRELLDECLDNPRCSVESAREKLLARLGDGSLPISSTRGTDLPGGNITDFVAAASDALLIRAGVRLENPHAAARDVAGMSLADIAKTCLNNDSRGSTFLRRESNIIRAALSTSDFPLILEDAIAKQIRRGFETEPASHRAWVRVQPVENFHEQKRPILGSAPDLELVVERGEYKYGAFSEDGTSYTVKKFGKIIDLSWETLKNDNLGVFLQRIPPAMGQAARRLEADSVYAMFAENSGTGPTMQDSVVLFHSSHANLAASQTEFDKDALGAGRLLLRKQTAVGGGLLSLVPRYLIVAAEQETDAEILIASATQHRSGVNANETAGTASAFQSITGMTPEWISRLQLVVEPRLDADVFYLACDNMQIDTVELGVLDENINGPAIIQDEAFDVDSMRWKVRYVFQPKFLDWRGIVQVPL